MPHERLGLFDTPPDRQEIRFAISIVVVLFAVFFLVLPVRHVRLTEFNAFIPMIDAMVFLGEMIIATLLYAQASVFRSRALSVLASGYVLGGLLLIPHALTFPGAFVPDGLLGGGLSTPSWLYTIRRAVFPIALILYVLLRRSEFAAQPSERPAARIGISVTLAVALAAAVTMLTTVWQDWLPAYFLNRTDQVQINALALQSLGLALFAVATAMLFRHRSSVLDIWLLVAFSGWLIQSLLVLTLQSRFTVGWYCLFAMTLFSHLVVMLALIAESNRLYARLALSTAARRREREARLMSMDAVTAAISHEVGQPLTAVGLNATAGLSWLNRPRPDVAKAITSLRAISDAGQRTFDVIRSIRAMFAKEPGRATEFNLNDLVLETASLLDRELAANKVSLQLELDEALPPIRADRVQLQRVLVNLFTNAIESLQPIRGRPRRITVQSTLSGRTDVLLQVADTGTGIEPEDVEHIFDAFFTTKATGTGLGLQLCRTIVEEHGGRLWASPGEPNGATFNLQLPARGAAAVSLEDTDQLLTNLEDSLRLLRGAKSDEVTNVIAELQQVVDEVRHSIREPKR